MAAEDWSPAGPLRDHLAKHGVFELAEKLMEEDQEWLRKYLRRTTDALNQPRFFFWKPQFYSWPIKFVRGSDEFGHHTIGIVTWVGSIFYRTSVCTPECPDYEEFM